MNYFVRENERKNTVYHEFQKGHFDEMTFGKEDSIYLHDDIHFTLELTGLFRKVISNYSDTDEVEVTKNQWKKIMSEAALVGGKTEECLKEANEWVEKTFAEYDVFTMIGL